MKNFVVISALTKVKYNFILLAVSHGQENNIIIQEKTVDTSLEDIEKYNIMIKIEYIQGKSIDTHVVIIL